MRGFTPIIVIVTTIALIASIIAIPSCHWVRLRGRNEVNRNLGIWRHANEDDRGWLIGNCVSYGKYFSVDVDAELRLARASTIISPIFASLSLFCNLGPKKIAGTNKLGVQLSLLGVLIAFIFQALTLTVNFSEACNNLSTDGYAYCVVGITTWAYWLSLCSSICYLIATLLACGQLSTTIQSTTSGSASPQEDNNNNQQQQQIPEQPSIPVANVDKNVMINPPPVAVEEAPLPPPMAPPQPSAPPAEQDTV